MTASRLNQAGQHRRRSPRPSFPSRPKRKVPLSVSRVSHSSTDVSPALPRNPAIAFSGASTGGPRRSSLTSGCLTGKPVTESANRRGVECASAPSKERPAVLQRVGDETLQIVRGAFLHAGGNLLGQKFEKLGHRAITSSPLVVAASLRNTPLPSHEPAGYRTARSVTLMTPRASKRLKSVARLQTVVIGRQRHLFASIRDWHSDSASLKCRNRISVSACSKVVGGVLPFRFEIDVTVALAALFRR